MKLKGTNLVVVIALVFWCNSILAQVTPPPPPPPPELSVGSYLCEISLIVLILAFLLYKKYSLQNKTTKF